MMRHAVLWLVATCLAPTLGAIADYELYQGVGYYRMHETGLNWYGAYSTCQFEGFDMVIINSQAEAAVIKEILVKWGRYEAFVGVTDLLWAGDHVALTGENLTQTGYQSWLGGSPSQDSKLRCVSYSRNASGGLIKVDCVKGGYVICERPLWRADYKLVPGLGYYKLYTEGAYWSNAWRTCRAEGANLAVINSDQEYEALQDLISQHPDLPNSANSSLFHIGLQGQFGQAHFVTVYGVPVKRSGYNKWEPGHPTNTASYAHLLRNDVTILSVSGVPVKRSGYNKWEPGHPTNTASYAHLLRNGQLTSANENLKVAYICEHALV